MCGLCAEDTLLDMGGAGLLALERPDPAGVQMRLGLGKMFGGGG